MGPKFRRKNNRIPGYDYSSNGYYFITIATDEHKTLFGYVDFSKEAKVILNNMGKIVANEIEDLENLDKYIVMPNHVHIIIKLEDGKNNRQVGDIVAYLKKQVNKELGFDPWQKSYHDHIIRNEKGYEMLWYYVEHNAERWREDKFYKGK